MNFLQNRDDLREILNFRSKNVDFLTLVRLFQLAPKKKEILKHDEKKIYISTIEDFPFKTTYGFYFIIYFEKH